MDGLAPVLPEYTPCYLILLIGVVGQVLLLIAFIKDPKKCFRNSATYLVANLAVSDLTVCLCFPFRATASSMEFTGGSISYPKWQLEAAVAILSVSFLTVLSLTIDRFLLVVYPFKHRYLVSGKRMIIWIALIWLVSILRFTKDVIFGVEYYEHFMACGLILSNVVLTVVFYSLTYRSIRRQAKTISRRNHTSTEDRAATSRVLREKRFLHTIIIIVAISVISITPLSIFALLFLVDNTIYGSFINVLECVFHTIHITNFAVNPLLYIWRLPQYRKTFKILYCR